MNVYFIKKEGLYTPFIAEDRIELYPDISWDSSKQPWDDFGYQTTFQMKLFLKNKPYELPLIKILIDNEKNTHQIFKEILERYDSEYIQFPIADINYIALPTDTEFYSSLYALLQKTDIVNILMDLHDASYIKNTPHLSSFAYLMQVEGFYSSLIRDMTSKKALDYGWLIVENRTIGKETSFMLNFKLDSYENEHQVPISFQKSIFPNNINILIGSNGSGKSQTLKYLIDELLGIGDTQQVNRIPVFNQIVVIAYSPFENYKTNLRDTSLTVKTAYQYFGFRDINGTFQSRLPFKNSMNAILKMLREDHEKNYFIDRPNKYNTFMEVISSAVDFDCIGFEIVREVDWQPSYSNKIVDKKYYMIVDKDDFLNEINRYDEQINLERGIVFFKDNKVIELSSGQQIFAQLISSIIGSIREDTILLLDEPELYLHPNLEVKLIDMLQTILKTYKSYAVIATHSSIFVREVAKNHITVLKKIGNRVHISKPPFETFGGDLERINSYVFFDDVVIKPYEKWLQQLVTQEGGISNVMEKYRDQLNEESIILMFGMEV